MEALVDRAFWSKRRVVVTGNTGFKGSWLSAWLHQLGAIVEGYSLEMMDSPKLFGAMGLGRRMNTSIQDVRDIAAWRAFLNRFEPEIVFHLAAQSLVRASYVDPLDTYSTNVMGTATILEGVRSCGTVRAVVIVTSDKCYENKEWVWGYRERDPMGGFDPYSSSKGCAELVASAYRQSFFHPDQFDSHRVGLATVRAGNIIGGGDWNKDRLVPDFVRSVMDRRELRVRNPRAVRPWQHVLEPLSGYITLAQRLLEDGRAFSEAWNFGPLDRDAKPVSWLVDELARCWGAGATWVVDDRMQPHEAQYLKLDISKAQNRLRWTPRWSLEEAIRQTVDWYREFQNGGDMWRLSVAQIDSFSEALAE